tara:strand:- start:2501 stop:3649 length:1149 start_codon:yes stop_codon:yes gene_type:complete
LVENDSKSNLRTGFTTGSCASAAAKAAVVALFNESAVSEVEILLPVGKLQSFQVHRCTFVNKNKVTCSIIKDAGDDPDVTHGAEICATVSAHPSNENEVEVILKKGDGVGLVTKPGTGIEVGGPAVTRVPRRMITSSVLEAVQSNDKEFKGIIEVELSVPGGEKIAEKTTNARLGVLGGISILGSTGIVHPYSTASWRASVHVAIDVAATNKIEHLVLTTGTRSEEYSKKLLDLDDMAFVQVGIFSGHSMKRANMRGIKRVSHVGMIGKFAKLAKGYFVTHVAGNQVDVKFLSELAKNAGASQEVLTKLLTTTSGREFQEIALSNGLDSIYPVLCDLVCAKSVEFMGDSAGNLIIDAMCFDFEGNLLGSSSTSGSLPIMAKR